MLTTIVVINSRWKICTYVNCHFNESVKLRLGNSIYSRFLSRRFFLLTFCLWSVFTEMFVYSNCCDEVCQNESTVRTGPYGSCHALSCIEAIQIDSVILLHTIFSIIIFLFSPNLNFKCFVHTHQWISVANRPMPICGSCLSSFAQMNQKPIFP